MLRRTSIGGIVKNAPNSLIWAVLLAFLGVIGALVTLSLAGTDSTDLRAFLNTILNIVSTLFGAGSLVVAGAAARSADKAVKQTNGLSASERQEIAERAAITVLKHKDGDNA